MTEAETVNQGRRSVTSALMSTRMPAWFSFQPLSI